MNYHVRFYQGNEGYTCVVYALVNGVPDGPTLALGVGDTQGEARDAAITSTTDPNVRHVLRSYLADE